MPGPYRADTSRQGRGRAATKGTASPPLRLRSYVATEVALDVAILLPSRALKAALWTLGRRPSSLPNVYMDHLALGTSRAAANSVTTEPLTYWFEIPITGSRKEPGTSRAHDRP